MQILIIRHASAEDRSAFAATGKSDDRRPLTDEGRRKTTEAAEGPRALVPHLDVIAASPLGHEPHLGSLVTWLLYGRADSHVVLKKGGACLVECDGAPGPASGWLQWLCTPAMLRRMAE